MIGGVNYQTKKAQSNEGMIRRFRGSAATTARRNAGKSKKLLQELNKEEEDGFDVRIRKNEEVIATFRRKNQGEGKAYSDAVCIESPEIYEPARRRRKIGTSEMPFEEPKEEDDGVLVIKAMDPHSPVQDEHKHDKKLEGGNVVGDEVKVGVDKEIVGVDEEEDEKTNKVAKKEEKLVEETKKKKEGFVCRDRSYKAKHLMCDTDKQIINNFLKMKITKSDYIWSSTMANASRQDLYSLLKGESLSDSLLDVLIERFYRKVQHAPSSYRSCFILRPWFYRSLILRKNGEIKKHLGQFTKEIYANKELILFPICSSGHWHVLVLHVKEKVFKHYSSWKPRAYINDVHEFQSLLGIYIEKLFGVSGVGSYGITQINVPQQGDGSLDCGMFMMVFIQNIAEGKDITVSQANMAKLRANWAVDLLAENNKMNDVEKIMDEHEDQHVDSEMILMPMPAKKKLLVLDVNGVLGCIGHRSRPQGIVADRLQRNDTIWVIKRPFCNHFLEFCFKHFDVAIWSSLMRNNLEDALDIIMGDYTHKLLFIWGQECCAKVLNVERHGKPIFLKRFNKLWEDNHNLMEENGYSLSNVLLVDNEPRNFLCDNKYNAIFPEMPACTKYDASLGPEGELRCYLENLVAVNNVVEYVEAHPFGQAPIAPKQILESFNQW